MRTTVHLPDDLLLDAKTSAARAGRTLTSMIEDALRAYLARPKIRAREEEIELPTYGRLGTQPGVDLDDSAGLLELMEEPPPGIPR